MTRFSRSLINWSTFIVALGVLSQATVANDWPRYGGPHGDFRLPAREKPLTEASVPHLAWRVTLGEGLSSVVISDRTAFVTYLAAETDGDSDRSLTEAVAAISVEDGSVEWEYRWAAGWRDDQEAFGGKSRAPQATPLIHGDRIMVLGFTGWLHCLDRHSGKLLWKADLVERFDAVPVQFGFSASPIVYDGQLILLTGGELGGLVSMDLNSGAQNWHLPCGEASYATPVLFKAEGEDQIVFVTREDVVGVKPSSGAELWRYELPKPGMTNVPTPLPLGDGRLAVSGQGVGGTRELSVHRNGELNWVVKEGWESQSEFFYCNWLLRDQRIIGCSGDLLVALDANTGARLARWRGYRDANLVGWGNHCVVVDGEGALSFLAEQSDGFRVLGRYQAMEERCWAPATIAGSRIFCRGGSELVCLDVFEDRARVTSAGGTLKRLDVSREFLPIRIANQDAKSSVAAGEVDPVESVLSRYEAAGAAAAWETYEVIRGENGQAFTLADREELAGLAFTQGLHDFGKRILEHAVEDFESDAATKLRASMLSQYDRQPSSETTTGDNGLVYLEIGILNRSGRTIQTVVRGPQQHPFSYGIPFPTGKLRIEKWPVGTKLYESNDEQLGRVLMTVSADDAGSIIDIGK